MNIKIVMDNRIDYTNFFEKFISSKMIEFLRLNCSEEMNVRLSSIESYIKDNYNIVVSSKGLIEMAFNNLIVIKDNISYNLMLNNNIMVPKTVYKLDTFIRLIEYGNLDVKGTNIVNNTFKYIKNNIRLLYNVYQFNGGNT